MRRRRFECVWSSGGHPAGRRVRWGDPGKSERAANDIVAKKRRKERFHEIPAKLPPINRPNVPLAPPRRQLIPVQRCRYDDPSDFGGL
jgi:hypothetical protein